MKRIPNYQGYLADEQGQVYSCFKYIRRADGTISDRVVDYSIKPKLLSVQHKPEKDRDQIRPHVILRVKGKRVKVLVSRLVAMAFLANPNKYPAVRHLNDISDDNRLSNLAWGTNKINIKDRKRNQNKDLQVAKLLRELNKYKAKYGELK